MTAFEDPRRTASDDRFKQLVEQAAVGLLIHRDGRPLLANQALADLFGYATPQEILQLDTVLRLFPEYEHAELRRDDDVCRHQQAITKHYDVEGLRQDGTIIWLESRVTVIDWDGDTAVQTVLTDITARKQTEAEVAVRLERLRTLTRLNRLVSAGLEIEQVLHEIVRAAATLTESAVVSCWTADASQRTVRVRAFSDLHMQREWPFATLAFGQGGVGWVAAHRRILDVPDVAADPRIMAAEWWQARNLHSLYAVPILFEGMLLGVLALNGRAPFQFTADDQELLDSFVAQAAVAIRNANLYRESEEQRRRLTTLVNMSQRLTRGLDLAVVLHSIAEAAAQVFEGEAGFRLLEGEELVRTAATPGAQQVMVRERLRLGESLSGTVASTRRPYRTFDAASDPRLIPEHRHTVAPDRIGALLCVPVLADERVLGTLHIYRERGYHFGDDELRIATSLADQAAIAIDNARLYGEALAQTGRLEALTRTSAKVVSTLDIGTLLQSIAEEAAHLLRVEGAGFRLLEEDRLVVGGTYGIAQHVMRRPRLTIGESLSGWVARQQQPLAISDVREHALPLADHKTAAHVHHVAAFLGVPLCYRDRLIGVLNVFSRRPHVFPASEIRLLCAFADQAAVAIEHVRLLEEARQQASRLETANATLQREIAERERIEALLAGQKQVLEATVADAPLPEVLHDIIQLIESLSPTMLASILLLDDDGVHLRHGAAPSLPEAFSRAVDGLTIGPNVGSCGTAVYRRDLVVVTDIGQDPLWTEYRELALAHGLRACWSTPIFDASGVCVGTFAMYYRVPKAPSASDRRLIELSVHLASLAIERHRAQEALRDSEERYRELFENANDIVYTHDLEGNFTSINKKAEQVTGYTHAEALRLNIAQIVVPEHLEYARTKIADKIQGEHSTTYELDILTKDGRRVALEVSTRLITKAGRPIGVQGIGRDITERRRAQAALRDSEERYRKLVEQSPDGILLHSDGRIVFVNSAAVRLLGASVSTQLMAQPIAEFINADLREAIDIQTYDQDAAPTVGLEGTFDRLDGQAIDVEVTSTATTYRNRPAAQLVFRDITSRKRLQAQLRQGQKMEAIGTLAGGIAHDFNNILAAILGYTELALFDVADTSPLGHNLRQIFVAGQRAKSLVRQILTFSRHHEVERQPVRIQQLLVESLELLRASLPATISIKTRLDTTTATILADPNQLQQVLMNLCANAEHAMRHTGGAIAIDLDTVDIETSFAASHPPLHAGPHVRLRIRDTGVGMPPAILERVFEPFFTTKDVGEGTGMGLAVVHGIVTNHGGIIMVDSVPEQGTSFTIYLPCVEAIVPEVTTPAATPTASTTGACILFVDDEVSLVQMAQELLEYQGYRVTACTTPQEAMKAFRLDPQRFDLVVTDQTMPYVTGEQLTRMLRELRPDVPVILCTGFSHTMTEDKARAMGIDAFIMKPFDAEALHQTIQEVLHRRHHHAAGRPGSAGA